MRGPILLAHGARRRGTIARGSGTADSPRPLGASHLGAGTAATDGGNPPREQGCGRARGTAAELPEDAVVDVRVWVSHGLGEARAAQLVLAQLVPAQLAAQLVHAVDPLALVAALGDRVKLLRTEVTRKSHAVD